MKYQHQIHLKNRETIMIDSARFSAIESAIMDRKDLMLKIDEHYFNAKDVAFVKRVYAPDYQQVTDYTMPDITDEQRADNLRKLAVLKAMFFEKRKDKNLEWVNPYSDGVKETMTREELRAFRQEFFDQYFASDAAEDRAMMRWLPYHRGQRDPRAYQRQLVLEESNVH